MVQPSFHFSREEYAQRLAQARRLLGERRLDALLLFAVAGCTVVLHKVMLAGEGCFGTRCISMLFIRRNWGRALPVYHYPVDRRLRDAGALEASGAWPGVTDRK